MSHRWPEESSFVPYTAQAFLPGRRLLVLAPHPDDEVLGCGGLIAATLEHGSSVQVVIVSDGAGAGEAATREQESRAAARALAAGGDRVPRLEFWRLPDRGLARETTLLPKLQHLIATSDAEWFLVPSPLEVHPDHRAVFLAALHAVRASRRDVQLLCYEVGHPLMPDVLVDITPQLERKRAALRCFASQLALQAYDDQVLGLNRYRAYTLGPTVSHAEAFQRVGAADMAQGLAGVIDEMAARLRRRFGDDPAGR